MIGLRLGSRRERRHEAARRQQALWDAYPTEGRIALVAVPITVLVGVHLLHLVPGIDDIIGYEELGAAGMLMALFSVLLIELTFGREARRILNRKQQTSPALVALSTDGILAGTPTRSLRNETVVQRLARLQQHDAGFSERLVGVFSRALVVRAAKATTDDARRALLPYITPAALADLHELLGPTDQVLPGPCRIVEVEEAAVWTTLRIRQPLLAASGGRIQHLDLRWTFRRTSAARSPSPVDLTAFGCPACGAPVQVTHPDGHCTTCQTAITHGQLCWQVVGVGGAELPPWPEAHPHGGDHPSLDPPTWEDPALPAALRALATRHPETPIDRIELRACEVAVQWLEALIAGKPKAAAAFCTEEQARSMAYEVGRLRAGRLTLTGGPVQVDHAEWLRAGRDGWHEVADLRVFLRTPWCIRDAEGHLVDGSPDEPRHLSLVVRLVHPTAEHLTLEGWRLWQLADPRGLNQ